MLSLIISTVVFIFAARYFHRALEDQGIAKGMIRGILVFALALFISALAAKWVDWAGPSVPVKSRVAPESGLSRHTQEAGRHRTAKVIALKTIAANDRQKIPVIIGFHAFRNHF